MMFTTVFWQLSFERAVKSFAQSLVAILGAAQIGLFDAHWAAAFSAAGMASLLSVLTSIGSGPFGPINDPSVVATTEAPTPEPAQVPVH